MNRYFKLIVLVLSSVFLTNCTTRIYSTVSNSDPITQAPPAVKEKGDLSIEASLAPYLNSNYNSYSIGIGSYVNYRKYNALDFNFSGQYAVRDHISLGARYKIGAYDERYRSHSAGGSINFFRNFETKGGKAVYGYDVLTSFQFKSTKNFVDVDEYFIDMYYLISPDTNWSYVFYNYGGEHLSYYKLRQNQYRFIVQPSFSVEHKWVSFFLGGAVAFQHLYKYSTRLEDDYINYLEDSGLENPLVYYRNGKPAFIGGVFWGLGVGKEQWRFFSKFTAGWSTDKMESGYIGYQLGISSNINLRKKATNLHNTRGEL